MPGADPVRGRPTTGGQRADPCSLARGDAGIRCRNRPKKGLQTHDLRLRQADRPAWAWAALASVSSRRPSGVAHRIQRASTYPGGQPPIVSVPDRISGSGVVVLGEADKAMWPRTPGCRPGHSQPRDLRLPPPDAPDTQASLYEGAWGSIPVSCRPLPLPCKQVNGLGRAEVLLASSAAGQGGPVEGASPTERRVAP
jgi:hypothetical protein